MLRELKENYERAKADLKGEARSHARMIKQAEDIPEIAAQLSKTGGPAAGIPGAFVRMKDGMPMQFHTDGSVRHAFGREAARAARKKNRKEARRKATAARTPVVQG